jgi:serine/threonine protein phosphatase 1
MEIKNMTNNTWVIGDVHGAYKALLQVLERAPIKKGDTIIQLGDIADGWSEVYECVELLISMQSDYNMIFCKGNHDEWFDEWLKKGIHPVSWLQGAEATAQSYARHADRPIHIIPSTGGFRVGMAYTDIPQTHIDFFNKQHLYYKDDNNRLFVHGGFNRHYTLEENKKTPFLFYWDRDLWAGALSYKSMKSSDTLKYKIKEPVTEVFIGHTATTNWDTDLPMKAANIWNLDTGAGFRGKLTIMNVETKEFFQSDEVSELYKHERGRNNY